MIWTWTLTWVRWMVLSRTPMLVLKKLLRSYSQSVTALLLLSMIDCWTIFCSIEVLPQWSTESQIPCHRFFHSFIFVQKKFFSIEHLINGIVNYETLRCRLGALTRACACFREFSTWTEIGLALCFPHIHSLSINLAVCLFVLVFLTLLPVRGQDTGKIFISWRRCNKDNGPIFHFFFPSLIQETPFVSWEAW